MSVDEAEPARPDGGESLSMGQTPRYTPGMSSLRILLTTHRGLVSSRFAKGVQGLPGVTLTSEADPAKVPNLLERELVDLAVVDLEMPSRRGINLVLLLRRTHPEISLLVLTDKDLRDYDREAIRAGVDGFLVQPVRPDHIRFTIQKIAEVRRLRDDVDQLRMDAVSNPGVGGIVGASGEMRRVFHLVTRAAATSVPVSLYGESGTGKELFARAIHSSSSRREGPFVAVNPSSIPETLLESELFGFVKGAFTGAAAERLGYFEAAHGGTLFLDEIGDIPLSLQVKLLRVLQEKVIHRVGSSTPVPVDFRLITATHRDLMAEVRAGRFREDLFYRIHVFPIYLPPLRARRGDIPLLAEHFLRHFARELGHAPRGFGPGVLDLLSAHSWPGNVRELENVVHRLVAMKAPDSLIEAGDLAGLVNGPGVLLPGPAGDAGPTAVIRPLDEHVRDYILWAFERLDRNKARTARMLEIDRATLYRKLREAGLEGPGPS
jgi:two-component system response regulator AtoC